MKLAIRAFAVAVVIAGAAAASVSSTPSHSRNQVTSHQAANATLPIPTCGPGMGCSANGN